MDHGFLMLSECAVPLQRTDAEQWRGHDRRCAAARFRAVFHDNGHRQRDEFCLAQAYSLANVAAWTEDCYVEDYRHTPTDGNPNTSGPCTFRVVRGGSWDDDLQVDRAARRYYYAAGDRVDNLGFRLARVVPP